MWKLVQPPNYFEPSKGGLGMDPRVAESLTREQAIFYLQSEKQVIADTAIAIRKANPEIESRNAESAVGDYMKDLRKKFTGQEDRDAI